ncbi:MAG: hypothetical protein ABI243_00240 [Lapillicoccus sp.]
MRSPRQVTCARHVVSENRRRRRLRSIRPTHGTTGCRDVSLYRPAGQHLGAD